VNAEEKRKATRILGVLETRREGFVIRVRPNALRYGTQTPRLAPFGQAVTVSHQSVKQRGQSSQKAAVVKLLRLRKTIPSRDKFVWTFALEEARNDHIGFDDNLKIG
jgi:hypothetical protein